MSQIVIAVIAKFHEDFRQFTKELPCRRSNDFQLFHVHDAISIAGLVPDAYILLDRLPDNMSEIMGVIGRFGSKRVTEEALRYIDPEILKLAINDKPTRK